jgi:uncharacterized protein YggE
MFKKFALIAMFACVPVVTTAADLPEYPFVHASGTGFAYVMPDIGEVDFEILAHDADPEVARKTVEERIEQIRALAESLGLAPEALEIRDVRKDIRKDQNSVPGVVLYDIKCGVHIKVKDLSKWRELMSPLINMQNLDGFMTEFSASEREKIEMELLADAVKAAKRRAEGMVAGFGKKLGSVSAVSSGQLANLSRAMGLAPTEVRGRSVARKDYDRRDLLAIGDLKLSQPVDVIFRIAK